jgi:hypothetical protein
MTLGAGRQRRAWRRARSGVVLLLAAGVLALAAASATATSDFTWTGGASVANWSNGTNWGGSAPSGTVGTLSFPALGSPACIDVPPTDTCYTSDNDVTGLSANAITLDDGAGDAGSGYNIYGDAITLGAGGFTASTTSSSPAVSNFEIPLTLGANQMWSIDDYALALEGAVTGGSHTLTIDTASNGELIVGADIEAGAVTLGGTVALYGNRAAPEGKINAVDGNPVSVDDTTLVAADNGGTSGIGAFTTSNGSIVFLGDEGGFAGQLIINGGATFDSSSTLSLAYGGAGTTPGTDYSQVSASGPVDLSDASLELYGSVPSGSSSVCVPLTKGNVATLVTTSGTLTGTFNGIPDGTVVPIGCSPASGTAGTVEINYTAHTVTATVISAGTTTTPPPPPPTTLLPSATQVNCDDENTGLANEYFQCTAQVADASGDATPQTPTGTVSFAINSGGGGGFQGSSTCTLAPSQSGPTSYCSVDWVAPTGGIAVGSQPPLTATYSGNSVFGTSSAQPSGAAPTSLGATPPTTQVVQQSLCEDVYTLNCSGIVAPPTDLADICVSLSGCNGDNSQGDTSQTVTIAPGGESLVVTDASIPARNGAPGVTNAEMDEYLSTKGSEEITTKVQYVLNYNTYDDQVTAARAPVLAAIQSQLESWKGSDDGNQYLATTLNGLSLKYTSQINDAYNAADQAGTDTSNLTVQLGNAWCNNYLTSVGRAACFADVAALQSTVNDSLSSLASKKASLGVNAPYTPPAKGLLRTMAAEAHAARAAKRTHPSSLVLAKSKTVGLAAGQTKKVRMSIPKVVRTELKRLWRKGVRTLHAELVVNLTLTTSGDFTTRTIPVTIHLARPKKKRH